MEPTERDTSREQDPAHTRPFEPLREHDKKASDRPAPPQPGQPPPPPWRVAEHTPERPLPPGYAPRPNDAAAPTAPSAPPVAAPPMQAPPASPPPAPTRAPEQPVRAPDPVVRPPADAPAHAPTQQTPPVAPSRPATTPSPLVTPAPMPARPTPSPTPAPATRPAQPRAEAATAARPAQPRAEAATAARPAVQVRRLRKGKLAIRKFDPWAIAKFSVVFYFCMLLIGLFGLGIIFAALKAFGVIGSLEKLLRNLQFDVSISGWTIFRWAFLIGLAFTLIATAITTFMAFLYNLIADVVGGIEMLVTEREQ